MALTMIEALAAADATGFWDSVFDFLQLVERAQSSNKLLSNNAHQADPLRPMSVV
jgi:hypothetical protein